MVGQKYEVFGRVRPGDDLKNIGDVNAPNDRLARLYAFEQYDEEDWDKLVAVNREHMLDATDRKQLPDMPGENA